MTHTSHQNDVATTVKSYVSRQQHGRVFSIEQMLTRKGLDADKKPAALKALSRLTLEQKIVRLANGVYYRPRVGRFGRLPLDIEELVAAVVKTKKATVVPAGVAAVNALGLDTQLPMVMSYFSSERLRSSYHIKNVKFEYKESLNFFIHHLHIKNDEQRNTALLFWSALSYLDIHGLPHYHDEMYQKFIELLKPESRVLFLNALPSSMKWVRIKFVKG